MSFEDGTTPDSLNQTSTTNDGSTPIKISAQFSSPDYPDSSFTVEFKNGILDLTVYGPNGYANMSYGQGLLGKCPSLTL